MKVALVSTGVALALALTAAAVRGDWTATVDAPGSASFHLEALTGRETKLRLEIASLATYASLLGVPPDMALDGSLQADALVRMPGAPGGDVEAEGSLSGMRLVLRGRKFVLKSATGFRVAGGKVFAFARQHD